MDEDTFVTPTRKKTTRKTSKPVSQSSQPSPANTPTTSQSTRPIVRFKLKSFEILTLL